MTTDRRMAWRTSAQKPVLSILCDYGNRVYVVTGKTTTWQIDQNAITDERPVQGPDGDMRALFFGFEVKLQACFTRPRIVNLDHNPLEPLLVQHLQKEIAEAKKQAKLAKRRLAYYMKHHSLQEDEN